MKLVEIRSFGDPGSLKLGADERPIPKPNEVLIKVAAAGVNRPDIMQRRGLYHPPHGASKILGLEVAGEVVDKGQTVVGWSVGDELCALTNGGGYSEYVVAPAGQCLPIPRGLELIEAASLPETFFTVWTNVFDRAALKSGESILIHGGTSGIGVAAIQMAIAMGARVYTTAGTDEKKALCEKLGAATAINYRKDDFVEILKELEPEGVNVILDMVGGDYINKNIKVAAMDGRIVNIALQNGAKIEMNYWPVIAKRLVLTGSTLRPQNDEKKAKIAAQLLEKIWPKIEAGEIKPIIDSVFPLDKVVEAHQRIESGEHIGKIMLQVS